MIGYWGLWTFCFQMLVLTNVILGKWEENGLAKKDIKIEEATNFSTLICFCKKFKFCLLIVVH